MISWFFRRGLPYALCVLWLSGCVSHPPATAVLREGLQAYGLDGAAATTLSAAVTPPQTAAAAVQLALARSPEVPVVLARLQRAQADHLAASAWRGRLSLSRLVSTDPAATSAELAANLSLGLSDLLFLPQRRRQADDALLVAQGLQLQSLLSHLQQVESGWWRLVAAQARRDVHAEIAQVASVSARLAQAYADAGNLSRRQRLQHALSATQAALDLQQADERVLQARLALQALIGLSPEMAAWTVPVAWPAPLAAPPDDDWLELAMRRRPDAQARARAVALAADQAGLSRWTAPLAAVEIDYAWQRETDGSRQRGPGLSLPLPFFGPGRSARLAAEADHALAVAAWQQWQLRLQHDLALAEQRLRSADRRLQQTEALVAQQQAVLAEDQQALNFMLTDVFAALATRRQLAEAELTRIDARHDYWQQYSALVWASGGAFAPGSAVTTPAGPPPAPQDHTHHHSH